MMKKAILHFLAIVPLFSAAQTYKPATFTDKEQLKKIESVFPLIDQLYKDYAEKNHFPGMAYGIVLDGKLVHSGGLGYSDVGAQTRATSKSDFRIASMSKSFTAMAILKLRDEGKLKLDDPITLYIPEAKNSQSLTKDAPAVTIRHLLTHSAGFPEDNPWGDRQLAATDEELLNIYKKGLSFSSAPGLAYEYSNLGFATLGYIIKKVSGNPYQQYITENILKPLGMAHTYWEFNDVPKNQLAHGYRWIDNQWVGQPLLHDGAYGAMGGLITTVEDFSKYMALHLDAWPPRDDAEAGPVRRSSIREMQYPWDLSTLNSNAKALDGSLCPTVSAYGYGMRWVKDCNGRVYVGHTGGLPGFGSQWNIMPEYGIGIVSFANLTYARVSTINSLALDSIIAVAKLEPRQLPASAILQQRKSELLRVMQNWAIAPQSGIFADNFFLDYSAERLQKEAADAFARTGKIRSVGELVAENQLRGYFILEGEKADLRVSFTLTPQNPPLIQEYRLSVVGQ